MKNGKLEAGDYVSVGVIQSLFYCGDGYEVWQVGVGGIKGITHWTKAALEGEIARGVGHVCDPQGRRIEPPADAAPDPFAEFPRPWKSIAAPGAFHSSQFVDANGKHVPVNNDIRQMIIAAVNAYEPGRAEEPPDAGSVKCLDCGTADMPIDIVLTGKQWDKICPGGGVLCGACIVRRASKLPNIINVCSRLIFSDDYDGGAEPGGRFWQYMKSLDEPCQKCGGTREIGGLPCNICCASLPEFQKPSPPLSAIREKVMLIDKCLANPIPMVGVAKHYLDEIIALIDGAGKGERIEIRPESHLTIDQIFARLEAEIGRGEK